MKVLGAVSAVALALLPTGVARAACAPAWQPVQGVRAGDVALASVSASSPTDVWAVGRGLAEHWDGAHWFHVVTPRLPNARFADVVAVDSRHAWLVGTAGRTALLEHWNGRRWSRVTVPRGGGLSLDAVDAPADDDVWIAGNRRDRGVLLHWNGRTLTTHGVPPLRGSYVDVSAASAGDVWALGDGDHPVAAHWNGRRWTTWRLRPPGNASLGVRALERVPGGDVLAVGVIFPSVDMDTLTADAWGVVFRWAGTSWTRIVFGFDGSYAAYDAVAASPYGTWIANTDTDPFNPQGGTRLLRMEQPDGVTTLPQGHVVTSLAWDGRFVWAVGWIGSGSADPNDYRYAEFRPLIERLGC